MPRRARKRRRPLLDAASDELLVLEFADTGLRDILDFLGDASGINVTYDEEFEDELASLDLANVTFEEALAHLLASHGAFYKVVNPTTIVVVPDTPDKRAALRGTGDPHFLHLTWRRGGNRGAAHGGPGHAGHGPWRRSSWPTRRPTASWCARRPPCSASSSRSLRPTTSRRAEIIIDVEILEVNRERAKQYGLDLSQYSISAIFSPEGPPAATEDDGASPPVFNLNTISRGISIADFYTAVPAAVVNFLEQDTNTRLIAQPQLRGQEGTELTLNLGQEIPVPTTAFTPLAAGGASFNPLTSYTYRPIGVIISMTPRVTYENEIHPRARSREQHAGTIHSGGGAVAAHVRHAQRGSPGCAFATANRICLPGCCASRTGRR